MEFEEGIPFYENVSGRGCRMRLVPVRGKWSTVFEDDFLIVMELSVKYKTLRCSHCNKLFISEVKLEYPYKINDQLIMLDAVLTVIQKPEELKKRIKEFEKILDRHRARL